MQQTTSRSQNVKTPAKLNINTKNMPIQYARKFL
jgi:hypothetical protein